MAILLSLVFIQPFLSARQFSASSDEIAHLPAGYSYLKTGNIVLNPQHPPLIKILAALPLLFLKPQFNSHDPRLIGPVTDEWHFGIDFLIKNNPDRMLLWGRLPIMLLSVLLGLYVFKWTRELFSTRAGLFSLFLYTFTPGIISQAQFVTTDLGIAVFSTIFLYYLWRLFSSPRRYYLVMSGVALGLALSAKFSAVLLVPISALLIGLHLLKIHSTWKQRLFGFLKIYLPIVAIASIVVYCIYFLPHNLHFYTDGMRSVYADKNTNFPNYLNGQFKVGGWWYYFIIAFLIKTPIPLLLAFAVSIVYSLLPRQRVHWFNTIFLLFPALLFFIATSLYAHDIGVRYILPVYPLLIIHSGQLIDRARTRLARLIMLIFGVWLVVISLITYPDYLAYFNESIGGTNNGYKYLDDSNITWGQDLKRLKQYLDLHPDTYIVYPWSPADEAFDFYGLPKDRNLFYAKNNWWSAPHGTYAIDSHYLIRAQIISQKVHDPSLDWLKLYQPSDRIGQSFFIYKF